MAERPLPTGWWKTIDQSSGKPYYYKADGVTRQWHFPGDPEPEEEGDDNSRNASAGNADCSGRPQDEGGLSQSDVEISIVDAILHFWLFPFSSVANTLVWGCIQLVFIILEIVVGFVSLKVGGIGYLKKDYDDVKISFIVVFLISDGFIWLGELVLHYILLKLGPAEYLLNNPPSLDKPLQELVPEGNPRILLFIRCGLFVLFRLFQLVWTIIAFFKLSLEDLFPTSDFDSKRFANTSNLVRLIGVAYVVFNFVSLTLWMFAVMGIFLLRKYGHEYLSPIPPRSVGTNTDPV